MVTNAVDAEDIGGTREREGVQPVPGKDELHQGMAVSARLWSQSLYRPVYGLKEGGVTGCGLQSDNADGDGDG